MMLAAARQRRAIAADFEATFARTAKSPSELNQITAELAEMDLAQGTLDKELESRLAYLESLKSRGLYLSLDTARKTLTLKSGNEAVRTASVLIAVPAAALKGAFNVVGKKAGAGRHVVFLPNDRVIFSAGAGGGAPEGLKAGSFKVSEADLQAIWDRITLETRVYVF